LPVIGWLRMRGQTTSYGAGFWVRPVLVELLLGAGFAALYWWEIGRYGLLPDGDLLGPLPAAAVGVLHAEFFAHLLLIALMLVASLIDADEKIIPDGITVPGTLLGLALAAICPWTLLPAGVGPPQRGLEIVPLLLTSPIAPPNGLLESPDVASLLLGLGCWWLWCIALMPRRWYARHGWRRGLGLLAARLRRDVSVRWLLAMGLLGSAGIAAAWFHGGQHWLGLLTALAGMAAGGGLIWMVRIVGQAVLKREAMGFGDVTLMAMIGTFLGWQGCLMTFVLANFVALVLGLLVLITRRQQEIPYGPFLSLGALILLVFWAPLWSWALPIFALGMWLLAVLALCLPLMAILLMGLQWIKGLFR
jgi:prepilin signal peptidase PulO-like enzyme (type II secretory pathway)